MNKNLPFELGTTYFGGSSTTIANCKSDASLAMLKGKQFLADDGNLPKTVMVVQNISGSSKAAGQLCAIDFDSGELTTGSTAKYSALPVDDNSPDIKAGDLGYVVVSGMNDCLAYTTDCPYVVGKGVKAAAGMIKKATTAADMLLGVAACTTATNSKVSVMVGAPATF